MFFAVLLQQFCSILKSWVETQSAPLLARVCRKSQGAAVEASRSFAADFSGAVSTLLPADPFPYTKCLAL